MGDKSPIEHLCQFAFTKQLVLIRLTKVLLAVLIQRNILKLILQTLVTFGSIKGITITYFKDYLRLGIGIV